MKFVSEAAKILSDEDPIIVTFNVLAQLQDRIKTGKKFTGIDDENWDAIAEKVSFQFLTYLLSMLWSESGRSVGAGTMATTIGSPSAPLQGQPEKWRGCHLAIVYARGTKKIVRAVVGIPNNPVKIVFSEPHLKLYGLENATQQQIRTAAKLIDPFKKRIRAGRPRKQTYNEAYARLEAGASYDEVLRDVQNEDPNITEAAFYAAMYYRGYRKKEN